MVDVARAQAAQQAAADPVQRFLDLLQSALAAGEAHLADGTGGVPSRNPAAWGWRDISNNPEKNMKCAWEPRGYCVGWMDEDNVFLEPAAAFRAAQSMAGSRNEALGVSVRTLTKRIKERGLLASIDIARQTLTVRRTLAGRQRNVLHIQQRNLWVDAGN